MNACRRAGCAVLALLVSAGVLAHAMGQAPPQRATAGDVPTIAVGQSELMLTVVVPEQHEVTAGAPLTYAARTVAGRAVLTPATGRLDDAHGQLPIHIQVVAPQPGPVTIEVKASVPFCTTREPKVCKMETITARQAVTVAAGGATRWSLPLVVDDRSP